MSKKFQNPRFVEPRKEKDPPLPEDHPLWDAPHCIITPHVSGGYALPETLEKILELSIENLERYEKGETLHNIIDFSTGYVKR